MRHPHSAWVSSWVGKRELCFSKRFEIKSRTLVFSKRFEIKSRTLVFSKLQRDTENVLEFCFNYASLPHQPISKTWGWLHEFTEKVKFLKTAKISGKRSRLRERSWLLSFWNCLRTTEPVERGGWLVLGLCHPFDNDRLIYSLGHGLREWNWLRTTEAIDRGGWLVLGLCHPRGCQGAAQAFDNERRRVRDAVQRVDTDSRMKLCSPLMKLSH